MLRSKISFLVFVIFCGVASQLSFLLFPKPTSAYVVSNGAWSWKNFPPVLVSSEEISEAQKYGCKDDIDQKSIVGEIDKITVCSRTGTKLGFGFNSTAYYNYNNVVSISGDSNWYKLYGIDGFSNSVQYSPLTDTLFTTRYMQNGFAKSLYIYRNFSSRIHEQYAGTIPIKSYIFDYSNPDYVLSNSPELYNKPNGYPLSVGEFKVSHNGKWVAVEIRNSWIGLFNTETLQIKRVTNGAGVYGRGMDPTVEMAISDTGANIAVMGQNMGFAMYDVTNDCGDIATAEVIAQNNPMPNQCQPALINVSDLIYAPRTSYDPVISNDGGELKFSINSYNLSTPPRRFTMQAGGYFSTMFDYIALGDSFTSGEGELDDNYYIDGTNNEFEKCHLSTRSYPYLMMNYWGFDKNYSKSVACSGAIIDDIVGDDNNYWGQGNRLGVNGLNATLSEKDTLQSNALDSFLPGRVHQVTFVKKYQPKIISIGIGGNDAGFMDKLKACLSPGTCEWALSDEGKEKTAVEIKNLFNKLVKTYTSVHQASPFSKIYALGYPKIIDENGSCDPVTGLLLDNKEKTFMNEGVKYLNEVISAAAKKVGIKYIDIYDSFGNSTLCGSSQPSSINAIRPGDDFGLIDYLKWLSILGQESFHPTPSGHAQIATFFNLGTDKYCQNDEIICPDESVLEPEPSNYWVSVKYHDYPKQRLAQFINEDDETNKGSTKTISLENGSLKPNSLATVEISSTGVPLGRYTVNSAGGISATISLPDEIESGFHTIHIFGTTIDGDIVDLYQVILYEKPEPPTQPVSNDDDTDADSPASSQLTEPVEKAKPKIQPVFGERNTFKEPTKSSSNATDPSGQPTSQDKPSVKGAKNETNVKVISQNVDFIIAITGYLVLFTVIFVQAIFLIKFARKKQ